MKVFVAIIPAGGCFVSDEALNEILSRKTIIQIKNNDTKCVWYSLVYCINNCSKIRNKYKFVDGKPNAALKTDALNLAKQMLVAV